CRRLREWSAVGSWRFSENVGGLLGLRRGALICSRCFRRHLGGNVDFTDCDRISRDRLLDDRNNAPAFQPAERPGFHYLNGVAESRLVLVVMDVENGLTVDDLMIEWVRGLV